MAAPPAPLLVQRLREEVTELKTSGLSILLVE
jgi:ABC-type branched-subunit amino acid transport system ATPase component